MKSAWTNLLTQLGTGSGVNQEIDNLRELGVDDILLSGQKCNKIRETRIVPDEYLGRGPLIGVYDRGIAEKIPQLIKEGGAPVRAVASVSRWNCFDYYGPEELLQNCNTAGLSKND